MLILSNVVNFALLVKPGLFLSSFFCILGGNVFLTGSLILLSIITIVELVLFDVLSESSGGRGIQSL